MSATWCYNEFYNVVIKLQNTLVSDINMICGLYPLPSFYIVRNVNGYVVFQ